jgi:uncharacterized OsmC-like protein
VGEVVEENKVLILKRIHVTYKLKAPASKREAAERAHGAHANHCPVAKSLIAAIDITTSLEIEEIPEEE